MFLVIEGGCGCFCTIWQHVSLFREHFLKSCVSHLNFKPDGSRGNTASFLLWQIPILIHCAQVFTWIPILVTAKSLFLIVFLQQPPNRCRKCYIYLPLINQIGFHNWGELIHLRFLGWATNYILCSHIVYQVSRNFITSLVRKFHLIFLY